MDKKEAKKKICETIDDNYDKIINYAKDIWENPELGFKEERTSKKLQEFFDDLGLTYEKNLAKTGVKANLKGKESNIKIGILGELDAVICRDHPDSDVETGAVHACGHHAQQAVMLATAIGLIESGMMNELYGDVSFIGVPAEEYIELEYRQHLKDEGEIEFFGGKQELIRLGVFDDIDMAAMIHLNAETPERVIKLAPGTNGFLGKTVCYKGKEAHAGAAPHQGINALNAAMLGLMGINAQRETFKDEDYIRVHPIITKGGDMVNNVPSEVTIESYVRGRTVKAIKEANKKVNMALEGGAHSVGAEVKINEIPGYLPLKSNKKLNDLYSTNAKNLVGDNKVEWESFSSASSDMGDISQLIPAIHPFIGGVEGKAHSRNFKVVDEEMAYVLPGKVMAMMIVDLLWDNAAEAKKIKKEYTPVYKNKEEYIKEWNEIINKD
ncbi:amidohydrolase [Halanaerobium sp. DL-01]|uniref:amidohydrolase n=1 Tax=Halanaerobium sp. DL-01 TaxID=1653064 RepID=UPI000DF47EB8|nr:amidohydrolase [Halanaerobium sp. DL-01]RCW82527.1 amidohydrolase [Halanaerobium sp. DL-01]